MPTKTILLVAMTGLLFSCQSAGGTKDSVPDRVKAAVPSCSPAESVAQPLRYYDNNVAGSVALCQAMARAGVFMVVSGCCGCGAPAGRRGRRDGP